MVIGRVFILDKGLKSLHKCISINAFLTRNNLRMLLINIMIFTTPETVLIIPAFKLGFAFLLELVKKHLNLCFGFPIVLLVMSLHVFYLRRDLQISLILLELIRSDLFKDMVPYLLLR